MSANAPKILMIKINPDMIGMVIGGGGKTIKEIKERTGAEITIEDDGTVFLRKPDDDAYEARYGGYLECMVEPVFHGYRYSLAT